MNDALIAKLRKVLALTNSPEEGEAQAAAAMLQKILAEHNLSIADLETRGQARPGIREQGFDLGKAAFTWKLDLAEGIAEFYYCAPIVRRYSKTVQFVGRPDNVEALTMLYGWVIDQIKQIATVKRREHFDRTGEHIDPLRWQLNFGLGAVKRLIVRLREMKSRQEEDAARNEYGDVVALAVHHKSEVSDFLEATLGYRIDGKLTKLQQERKDQARRIREAKDALRIRCQEAGDMTPYYELYPEEHPGTIAKRKTENDLWWVEYQKREARNAKRRRGGYGRVAATDDAKLEQSDTANRAGRDAAKEINLQPFLKGGTNNSKLK